MGFTRFAESGSSNPGNEVDDGILGKSIVERLEGDKYLVNVQGLEGLEVGARHGVKSKALWRPVECL